MKNRQTRVEGFQYVIVLLWAHVGRIKALMPGPSIFPEAWEIEKGGGRRNPDNLPKGREMVSSD